MGLRDAIDDEKRNISLLAEKWITESVEPAVREKVAKGWSGLNLFPSSTKLKKHPTFDIPSPAVFWEAVKQMHADGFQVLLSCVETCCEEVEYTPSLGFYCNGKYGPSHWCYCKIIWEQDLSTSEKSNIHQTITEQEPTKINQAQSHQDMKPTKVVQNITLNIQDSAISGDINSNFSGKNDD